MLTRSAHRSRTALLILAASLPLAAQRRVEPPAYEQPKHSDIVLGGNNLHQTVTCQHGNAVYIQGQDNQVNVKGLCRYVRVQGNYNHVFEEQKSPIHVEGNGNFIEITDFDTPFSERGEGNRVERRTR